MIKWITNFLGTSAYSDNLKGKDFKIVDVRDLVDKSGNTSCLIRKKIDIILDFLNKKLKVVICCDYGMSRSNAIAVGVICKLNNENFHESLKKVLEVTKEEIKLDILQSVKNVVISGPNVNNKCNNKCNFLVLGGSGSIGRGIISKLKLYGKVYYPSRLELNIASSPAHLYMFCEKYNINTIFNLAYPRISNSYAALGEGLLILRNILEVLKYNKHINLICVSSWVVFSGYKKTNIFSVNESTIMDPEGICAENKYFCEKLIEYYFNKYQELKIFVIRLSMVYGTKNTPRFIYDFIHKALSNEDIYTHEYFNGSSFLHLIHIDDVCEALEKFVLSNPLPGYYNLSGSDFLSTSNIAEKVINITESSSKLKTNKINSYAPNIFINSSKIRQLLKWEPKINFDLALQDIIKVASEEKSCQT